LIALMSKLNLIAVVVKATLTMFLCAERAKCITTGHSAVLRLVFRGRCYPAVGAATPESAVFRQLWASSFG